MGRLRVGIGATALALEHRRLLRTALRRGRTAPERQPGECVGEASAPAVLELARETWRRRMVHEHQSAAVFSRLLPQLIEAEATLDVKTAVLRMAMDELRHAALCGDVVEALGGRAEAELDLATAPLPDHEGCTPVERALRNVLFVGCLSETVGLALLAEERATAGAPLVRRVTRQLCADELLHARLGWAHLADTWPRLDGAARRRTERYLAVAFRHLEGAMLAAMPLPSRPLPPMLREELHQLGVLPGDEAREVFQQTIAEVIVPRLGELGLDGATAWRRRAAGDSIR